jgi:hypothetical protein
MVRFSSLGKLCFRQERLNKEWSQSQILDFKEPSESVNNLGQNVVRNRMNGGKNHNGSISGLSGMSVNNRLEDFSDRILLHSIPEIKYFYLRSVLKSTRKIYICLMTHSLMTKNYILPPDDNKGNCMGYGSTIFLG